MVCWLMMGLGFGNPGPDPTGRAASLSSGTGSADDSIHGRNCLPSTPQLHVHCRYPHQVHHRDKAASKQFNERNARGTGSLAFGTRTGVGV